MKAINIFHHTLMPYPQTTICLKSKIIKSLKLIWKCQKIRVNSTLNERPFAEDGNPMFHPVVVPSVRCMEGVIHNAPNHASQRYSTYVHDQRGEIGIWWQGTDTAVALNLIMVLLSCIVTLLQHVSLLYLTREQKNGCFTVDGGIKLPE